MRESPHRPRVLLGIALGLLLQASLLQVSAATAEDREPEQAGPTEAAPFHVAQAHASEFDAQPGLPPANPPAVASVGFDSSVVAAGQAAFDRSCTTCHDAQRALGKSKSYALWLGTVRRMASKDGADIRSSDVAPIAAYLASISGASAAATGMDVAGTSAAEEGGGWTFGATVSTLHRSASDESPLENPGFFADVWVTASYQAAGPFRANVTACTSCHSTDSSINGYSLELAEGSATLDLRHLLHGCRCDDGREALLKAGRFVVPFGAYSAMSHPGIYRTLTNPLMFNMGRRVFVPGSSPPQQPVLPMPFADEGIDFMFRTPLSDTLNFTFDLYAVNGLQSAAPDLFNRSRRYTDNNEEPSGGMRMTLGGDFFRLGTSVLGGNLQDQGFPAVDYTLAGADATAQITDRLRFYFEYAMRRQDSVIVPGTEENTYGIVAELEMRVLDQPDVGLLVRYDTLEHRNQSFGDASLGRFTWGFNIGLPGGSLLLINHERWWPGQGDDVDVLGARWVVSL